MPLGPGTRLGPYEILAPLGAGGMGEVYIARDPRVDRNCGWTSGRLGPRVAIHHLEDDATGAARPNLATIIHAE
jgi:hypothetical protein